MVYFRDEGEKTMKKALFWGVALCAALIFAGCPAEDPEPEKPFTLTVTGLPEKFMGASLLNENDIINPIATGTPGAGGTFTFYHPGPDGRLPSSKPFNTRGNYLVALAEVDTNTFQETAVYFYISKEHEVTFPVSAPLPWSDFVLKED